MPAVAQVVAAVSTLVEPSDNARTSFFEVTFVSGRRYAMPTTPTKARPNRISTGLSESQNSGMAMIASARRSGRGASAVSGVRPLSTKHISVE